MATTFPIHCNARRILGRVAAALLAIVALAPRANAQAQAVVLMDGEEVAKPPQTGFSVRKADTKILSALEDFNRYIEKKAWDKAFSALSTVAESDRNAFVPAKGGLLLPVRSALSEAVCAMPAPAIEAYRLFNDARARQLLEQAGDGSTPEQQASLRDVVERYFATAVGDNAADVLAESMFQTGDFASAAALWDQILTRYPSTDLPILRLKVKRAIASYRAGNKARFQTLRAAIAAEHPGESLKIAGHDVPEDILLQQFAVASTAVVSTNEPPPLAGDAKLVWQTEFLSIEDGKALREQLINMGWGGYMRSFDTTIPDVATDGKRVYANWLGIGFAVDVVTGKLLWRTDAFAALVEKKDQVLQTGLDADRFFTTVAGDRVLFVRVPQDQFMNRNGYRLTCHDVATGKQIWSTDPSISFAGRPIVVGKTIYAITSKAATLTLNVLSLETGKPDWALDLGTAPTVRTSPYYSEGNVRAPTLLIDGQRLLVSSNGGGLAAVNLGSHRLEWVFLATGQDEPTDMDNIFYNAPLRRAKPQGALFYAGGIVMLKEAESRRLHAIDPGGPTLLWSRPLSQDENVQPLDDDSLLLTGPHIGVIRAKDRKLLWTVNLPPDTGVVQPAVRGGELLATTSRGMYEIALDGNVRRIDRGRETESLGGTTLLAGNKCITVTNRNITAYEAAAPTTQPKNP